MDIDISYMWQSHYAIRVERSCLLPFRGDAYSYGMLQNSAKLKVYKNSPNDCCELLKDYYGRLWLHVRYEDWCDDRIEETFDMVENVQEADIKSADSGYHYQGSLPFFHATENYDFILHEDPVKETEGYIENKTMEIISLNHKIKS